MEVHELITRLTRRGAKIEVVDDQLRINAGKGIITPELQTLIRENKKEIIGLINKASQGIRPAVPKAQYVLSSQQKRLYFLHQFDPGSLAYNESAVYQLQGQLDKDRLAEAFRQLIVRHEILRTSFQLVNGEPVQTVSRDVAFDIEYFGNQEEVPTIISKFIRPFDLEKPCLMRVGLIAVGHQEHLLMVDLHHIVTDGVSKGILAKDFMGLYHQEALPVLNLHYKDYAEWQQGEEQLQQVARQQAFWNKQFANLPPVADLPIDHARPLVKNYAGASHEFDLDTAVTNRLKQMAGEERTTLYSVLLSIFNILLSKLSNQEDIIIGTPTAGRQHADLENMMGMLINTLPLRNYPRGDLSYRNFLATVRDHTLACFDNQSYPYEELVVDLNIPRDTSRNPLFDTVFIFHNFQRHELAIPGLVLKPFDRGYALSKFDLTLEAMEVEDGVQLKFEYSTELFKASTIERYAVYFKQLVQGILVDAATQLKDISLLGAAEKNTLLQDFNDTRAIYPASASLVSLFDEQVARTPDAVAVVYGGEEMSYRTLQEKSELVAAHLLQLGLQKGGLVGLLVDRGPWLLPCILGILKAGGAYVPIDPFYPTQRIQYVLEDSGVGLVLTTLEVAEELQTSARFVDIRSLTELPVGELPNIESDTLAYMIYTSGSTGQPKGVMISHRNVVNFVYGVRERISFAGGSRMLCLTTVSFDIFVLETMLPLLSGMTVVLAGTSDQKNPLALLQLIREARVDFMQITPSHLKLLLDSTGAVGVLSSLKVLMAGGEGLPVWLLEELRNKLKGRIYNMYGPTETTVWSTIADLTESGVVHIGRPIANTSIRILDRYGKLVPVGVAGELCIGGDGLSRGYWQRERLTKERFIDDPYEEGQLLYRTGDAGRWQADGTLLCGGRLDDQVKIRGHRIEPGEIETLLNGVEGINRSVVVAVERAGEKLLAAYYEGAAELGAGDLRASLSGRLPDYMLPSYFVWLERLPLTPNGKLNRRELPDPVEKGIGGGDYIAPANSTEEQLVQLWSEVLKLDKGSISTDKSFFELGGHSIRAIHLINKIELRFGVKLPLRKVFEQVTISRLSGLLAGMQTETAADIPAVGNRDYYIASSAQERLFFEQLLNKDSITSNISMAFELQGKLDMDRIRHCFQLLVNRHEALRTRFMLAVDELVQVIEEETGFEPETLDPIQYAGLKEASRYFVRPFDLAACPLMRCAVLPFAEKTYMLVDLHHIVCDGLSLNILMTDFKQLYAGLEPSPLGQRYVDYASWQKEGRNQLHQQKAYWQNQLAGEWQPVDLPVNQSREAAMEGSAGSGVLTIEGALYTRLKKYTAAAHVSDFMFLLSVYYTWLYRIGGSTDILIGTDAAGRTAPSLKHTVGTFINVLPLRMQVNPQESYEVFLQAVKTCVLEAFDNQEFQFDELSALFQRGERKMIEVYFSTTTFFENETVLEDMLFVPVKLDKPAGAPRYELEISVGESDNKLQLTFLYNTALYDPGTMGLFMTYYNNLLQAVLDDPAAAIEQIQLV
jgi:amino acid adenylation domain-containing protein